MRIALADLAEGLREGDGELAALAERQDGVADFLRARHPEVAAADASDQALHPLVASRRIQCLHEIAYRDSAAERGPGQRPSRSSLRDAVGEIQGQHGAIGHRMLGLGKKPQRDHGDRNDQHDDRADDGAQTVDDSTDKSEDMHGLNRFLDLWVAARSGARRTS